MAGSGGWDDSKTLTQGVNRGMWFLENRIPTLGEVRGKVITFMIYLFYIKKRGVGLVAMVPDGRKVWKVLGYIKLLGQIARKKSSNGY